MLKWHQEFQEELWFVKRRQPYFEDDAPRPVKAVVMNPHGPGGGNPEITFTFLDEDHAWEWASNNMDMEYDDFMLMLNK